MSNSMKLHRFSIWAAYMATLCHAFSIHAPCCVTKKSWTGLRSDTTCLNADISGAGDQFHKSFRMSPQASGGEEDEDMTADTEQLLLEGEDDQEDEDFDINEDPFAPGQSVMVGELLAYHRTKPKGPEDKRSWLTKYTDRKSVEPLDRDLLREDQEARAARELYFLEEHELPEYLSKPENRTFWALEPGLEVEKDDSLIDPEAQLSKEVNQIKEDLAIPETFMDEWYTEEEVDRYISPIELVTPKIRFEPKDFMNNRFTDPKDKTDFDSMDPYRARKTAVQFARATNTEWLPEGYAESKKLSEFEEFEKRGLLVGTLRPGRCDADITKKIQPALKIFNGCVDLLSIEEGVFRFHYHGLIKHKFGMSCYMESCLKDCDIHCTGVVFETTREKDLLDGSFMHD